MKSIQERFELKWILDPLNGGCWLWTAAKNNKGYGAIVSNDGKWLMAHRVSWELYRGEIPIGIHVLHRCDNPSCVNPSHLFLGTSHDNHMDMSSKGRGTVGTRNFQAKLTEREIALIRSDNRTQDRIEEDYGVSRSNIGQIKQKKTWRHVS